MQCWNLRSFVCTINFLCCYIKSNPHKELTVINIINRYYLRQKRDGLNCTIMVEILNYINNSPTVGNATSSFMQIIYQFCILILIYWVRFNINCICLFTIQIFQTMHKVTLTKCTKYSITNPYKRLFQILGEKVFTAWT